jgi:hypothetical protein
MQRTTIILALLMLLAAPLAAAIVPKPPAPDDDQTLPTSDMPGIDVQLKSMDLSFELRGTPRVAGTGLPDEHVAVRAEYVFKNHGAYAFFEVGMVIGNMYDARNFQVQVDGATVESRLTNLNRAPRAGGRGIPLGNFRGYWDMT